MYLCKMQKCVVSAKANLQPNRQKHQKNEIYKDYIRRCLGSGLLL